MVVVSNSESSGGQFVRVPVGIAGGSDDFVEFSVTIDTAGSYQVNAGVRGPSGTQNSFFAQIDEGTQYTWDIPSNNQSTEVLLSDRSSGVVTETLAAGDHTFRVIFREAGAQLDFIEFKLQGVGS